MGTKYKVGDKIGFMTIIGNPYKIKGTYGYRAKFECECGRVSDFLINKVKSNNIQCRGDKCGYVKNLEGKSIIESTSNRCKYKIGDVINGLQIIGEPYKTKTNNCYKAKFKCYCGKSKDLFIHRAVSKKYNCVCEYGDNSKKFGINRYRENYVKLRLREQVNYKRWLAIKLKCYDDTSYHYKKYGAVGVTMCDEWLNSFDAFNDYIGQPPFKHSMLKLIQKNLGFKPGNVIWAEYSPKK